ncbi:hypothetical protein LTR08_001190 [Meristemomyces frigidus]|nr:hypothetical protein LTR08_001190 [Meristemomyces frigidus]
MARHTKSHTPKAQQQTYSDEAAGDVDVDVGNDGDLAPDSDDGLTINENNGRVQHLGSDLPDVDVPSGSGDAPGSSPPSEHASTPRNNPIQLATRAMGTNGSHDELNAALHTASAATPRPRSNGKLKQLSTRGIKANPPYRNPAQKPPNAQRRMGPSTQTRLDTYDVDITLGKTPQLRRKRDPASAISPTRKQRKAVQELPQEARRQVLHGARAREEQQMRDQQLSVPSSSRAQQQQEIVSSARRSKRRPEGVSGLALVEGYGELRIQGAPGGEGLRPAGSRHSTASVAQGGTSRRSVSHVEINVPPAVHGVDAAPVQALEATAQLKPKERRAGRPRKSPIMAPSFGEIAAENDAVAAEEARVEKDASKPPKQSLARARKGSHAHRQQDKHVPTSQISQLEGDDLDDTIRVSAPTPASYDGDHIDDQDQHHMPDPQENDEQRGGDDEAEQGEDRRRTQEPQVTVKQKPVNAKVSEVFPGATGDPFPDTLVGETRRSPRKGKVQPVAKVAPRIQKRKAPEDHNDEHNAGAASTSQKRRKGAPLLEESAERDHPVGSEENLAEEPVDPDEPSDEPLVSERSFYGQGRTLQRVFHAVNAIGVRRIDGTRQAPVKIKLRNADVKAIVGLCDQVMSGLSTGTDPAAGFASISEEVEALYTATHDSIPDFANPGKAKDIYFHLFPKLVEVLESTIAHYQTVDERGNPSSPLTKGHLKTVITLIHLILALGEGVKDYVRVPTELVLMGPVRNGIVAPLKKVYTALSRVLDRQDAAEAHRHEQQREAHARAQDAQREVAEERQAAEAKRVRSKWVRLHEERLWAEVGRNIPPVKKLEHLQVPRLQAEADGTGGAFERVQIFAARVGPTPAMVAAARALVWTGEELEALAEGLRVYAGADVFEKVMRRFCPRLGALNRFSVTEIVTVAAMLREWLVEGQGEGVEEWVMAIPVWTRGHTLGKENEGGEVGDAHDDGDDDDDGVEA